METLITEEIRCFVREDAGNRYPDTGEPYFAEPLIGFAAADDPIFVRYKDVIGDFHQTPQEVLAGVHGEEVRAATVITWVLPVTGPTRESNRRQDQWPSRQWALTRAYGEEFNSAVRRHVVAWLQSRGHLAVAPQLAPGWQQFSDTAVGVASTWSERHAAYAAGLGTFSLNDAVITEKGIAHRLGSVITDLGLKPTARLLSEYHNCLWYREGTCGACISRCPVGALSWHGHDKAKCRDYVYGAVPEAVGTLYGVTQTGCGLCQTRVPCEAMIPPGKSGSR